MTKSQAPASGPGKRELQKEARRVAIIDAALEEFTAQGFTATKLDDVAVRAGIGKGTIYLYFDSKESLFEEVVRRNLLGGREMVENFVATFEGSTAELLTQHFRNMYLFTQNDKIPPLMAMITGEAVRFPSLSRFFYDEVIKPMQELMRRIVRRGIERGEFRADVDDIYIQILFAPVLLGALNRLQYGAFAP
ncbi:MAG: TetR/AcrR family transcriptional regulator, partial [Pseudomonadota bacterium]|nr:TetR/AcrR family transcriptional regulator [Pseudomonadota bacterium]